jgi:hypothetical protein
MLGYAPVHRCARTHPLGGANPTYVLMAFTALAALPLAGLLRSAAAVTGYRRHGDRA